MVDKKQLEHLFGMGGGYVLDFSNATFSEFFNGLNVAIDNDKYALNGTSKAKRLRVFWSQESNAIVGESINELLNYVVAFKPDEAGGDVTDSHRAIVNKLCGNQKQEVNTEASFLKQELENITLNHLKLDIAMETVIKQRINEIKICLHNEAWLSVVFLTGSSLEGILLNVAVQNPKVFNQSTSAPKRESKVKPFHDWTLSELIDVAYSVGSITLNVKKFSHALRDFRNYIHPNQQAMSQFQPNKHTAKICWQVLCAAIIDLSDKRRVSSNV